MNDHDLHDRRGPAVVWVGAPVTRRAWRSAEVIVGGLGLAPVSTLFLTRLPIFAARAFHSRPRSKKKRVSIAKCKQHPDAE